MKINETEDLWRSYQSNKDQRIRQELIERYLGVVKNVAGKLSIYLNHYVDVEDLEGYGIIGLIDAIDKFDLDKQVKFETYASLRIRGAILDEIRKLDWVPRTLRKKQKDLQRLQVKLENELGRRPEEKEIVNELGVTEEAYQDMVQEINRANLVFMEDYQIQISQMADQSERTPEQSVERDETLNILESITAELPERERLVLTLYYYEELTLKEISYVLEVSESRVSQIHTKALNKIRKEFEKNHIKMGV